jgi:hypothetical protein
MKFVTKKLQVTQGDDLWISQYWKLKPTAPPLWANIEQNSKNTVIDGDSYFLLSLTYGVK